MAFSVLAADGDPVRKHRGQPDAGYVHVPCPRYGPLSYGRVAGAPVTYPQGPRETHAVPSRRSAPIYALASLVLGLLLTLAVYGLERRLVAARAQDTLALEIERVKGTLQMGFHD